MKKTQPVRAYFLGYTSLLSCNCSVIFSLFTILLLILNPSIGRTQIAFTGAYSQNFDGMGTGSAMPAGWSHIGRIGGTASSWTTTIPVSGNPSAASSGTVNNRLIVATNNFTGTSTSQAFNYSDANTSNRSLGTSPAGDAGNILQLILTNNTGGSFSNLNLAYQIRRFANAAVAESIPGYRLFFSINAGVTWISVATLNPTLSTLPNSVGTSNFNLSLTLPAPVQASGQIRFRWVDDNSAGSAVDQRIGLDNLSISLGQPSSCGVPSALQAAGLNSNSAFLSWQPVPGAISYNLQWRSTSATGYTIVSGLTAANYSLTGLQATTSYEFQVQAVCSTGTGAFSSAFTFVTTANNPLCSAATNLGVSNITSTSALLSWASVGGNLFNVFWKPVNASLFNIQSNVSSTVWQLNGLAPGTNYVFQVQSICGGTDDVPSIPAELSTPFVFTTAVAKENTQAMSIIDDNTSFAVWPNPIRNGLLNIKIEKIDRSVTASQIDLFDLSGKRMASFLCPVQVERLHKMVSLPNELSNGIYIIKVSAGNKQYHKRLMVL